MALTNRGHVYSLLGQHAKALADLDEAIRLNPKNDTAFNNRGLVYFEKREYERAIKEFDESIRLNPRDAIVYHNRGLSHHDLGNVDKGNRPVMTPCEAW